MAFRTFVNSQYVLWVFANKLLVAALAFKYLGWLGSEYPKVEGCLVVPLQVLLVQEVPVTRDAVGLLFRHKLDP